QKPTRTRRPRHGTRVRSAVHHRPAMNTSDSIAGGDIATVQAIIEELEATITALDARLRALEQTSTNSATSPDTEDDSEYAPLSQWVDWFRDTFNVDEITDAWDTIPGVTEELGALHTAWQASHSPQGV